RLGAPLPLLGPVVLRQRPDPRGRRRRGREVPVPDGLLMTTSTPESLAAAHDLTGRVAVVTGAASGIGRASALRLAEAGATVVCADLDEAGAEETRARIR